MKQSCFSVRTLFIASLLILSSSLVRAQYRITTRPVYESKPSLAIITLCSIKLVPSVSADLADDQGYIPSAFQPKKYLFYVNPDISRDHHNRYPNRSTIKLLISYKIVDGSREISGAAIKDYIDGQENLQIKVSDLFKVGARKWYANPYYGIGVKFKEAYYRAGYNKYKLVICVQEEGELSNMSTLTIEPMDTNMKLNEVASGCNNRVSLMATRTTTAKIDLDFSYWGTGINYLDNAPSLISMNEMEFSKTLDMPLRKIYANEPKKLQILTHARGYTPSLNELIIPAANGLALSAGEPELDLVSKKERIPITISIPECHVNNLSDLPISLAYSNDGQVELDNPPPSVVIPKGQHQYQFDLVLKPYVRYAKNLDITASSIDFENTPLLVIPLSESSKLLLEAAHNAKRKNIHAFVSITVKVFKSPSIGNGGNIMVNLTYEGAGAAYLLGPPSKIEVSSSESKTIIIYLNERHSLCPEHLKITACVDGSPASTQTVTLSSSAVKSLVLSAGD